MDIREIIESGKLELYALGALDEQDQKEIEALLAEHPSLQDEYDQIVNALQEYGKTVSPEPPQSILDNAKRQIDSETPIPMHQSDKQGKKLQWWSAAATILLLASVGLNLKLNNELKESRQAYLSLEQENQQMAANTVEWRSQAEDMQSLLAKIAATKMQRIYMAGTDKYKELGSTVFWDSTNSEVILATNSLPVLSANEQYQLWAIVDGNPVDAGVFDADEGILRMKEISGKAVAFAVTIEPKGGSAGPTLEKMCMLGEVKS